MKKVKAFDETLARFEAHAKHLDAVGKKEAVRSKSTAKAGSTATRESAAKKRPAKHKVVPAAVVQSRLDQAGAKRIQGHTGTQVRIAQAKRDKRG